MLPYIRALSRARRKRKREREREREREEREREKRERERERTCTLCVPLKARPAANILIATRGYHTTWAQSARQAGLSVTGPAALGDQVCECGSVFCYVL